METLSDWRGVAIEVGSKIVYPVKNSTVVYVIEGKVVEILPSERGKWDKTPPFKLKVQRFRSSPAYAVHEPGKVVTIDAGVDKVTVVGYAG
jgi:hypothetical protein